MAPGTLARIAGATALAFGGVGLVAPELFAAAFGIHLDTMGVALARLACASYVGVGALNLMARNVEDARAWQAISVDHGRGPGRGSIPSAPVTISGRAPATVTNR